MKPISPKDVASLKTATIPAEVVTVFNELIASNWNGSEAVVREKDAAILIANRVDVKQQYLYDQKWMDIEDTYRKAGWVVVYDSPAYCETYDATYTFSKKRKRKGVE